MKKSADILSLPIISITEGRELGMSKTLVIDAKNGMIAAITIEDEEWYRGVKLIPYASIIAIGDDAITILHSDKILKLSQVGDYEAMLDENIKILGTKAITKTGTIQGKICEIFVGDNGRIEKCEIRKNDGSVTEVLADNISIFGKQVTVIDPDGVKKTPPAVQPIPEVKPAEIPVEKPVEVVKPVETTPPPVEEIKPVETPAPVVEEVKPVEEIPAPVETPAPAVEEVKPAEENPVASEVAPVEEEPEEEEFEEPDLKDFEPEPAPPAPEPKQDQMSGTNQAEALKAALKRAMANQQKAAPAAEKPAPKKSAGKMPLLGKKAVKTIIADNGNVIIEEGEQITEEVLQKAKIANKLIELSMNCVA